MKVLHICSDFPYQDIYKNLTLSIGSAGVEQVVYVAARKSYEADSCALPGDIPVVISRVINPLHRIFFRNKISTVLSDIESRLDLSQFDVVHAHFLYSDGGVARLIKERYNVPYIVSVRNTDVNKFMRYRKDLNFVHSKIVDSSSFVTFLSPAYRDSYVSTKDNFNRNKFVCIPNGINDFWHHNANHAGINYSGGPLKLLYVGDFSKNKNVLNLIAVCKALSKVMKISLTLVGGGGGDHDRIISELNNDKNLTYHYLGRVDDRKELLRIYRDNHIFVMVSIYETFGVSYIEALSQGLPIVHSINQGVDGYFEDEFAVSVDPNNIMSIADSVLKIKDNINGYSTKCVKSINRFDWKDISNEYIKLYRRSIAS